MPICKLLNFAKRLAFLLGAACALTGCGTFELPRDASARLDQALLRRKPASLAGWEDERTARWLNLKITELRVATLLNGWDRVVVQPVPQARGGISYGVVATGIHHRTLGSAVAVTGDGYFLTAAHCADDPSPHTVVALDRKLRVVKGNARIVWTSDPKRSGVDLALIHAPIEPAAPFRFADLDALPARQAVAIAGCSALGSVRRASPLAAGRILSVSRVHGPAGFIGRRVEHNAPLNPGDSGGPLITPDGQLAGVNAIVRLSPFASLRLLAGWDEPGDRPLSGYKAKAFAPDPAWLQRLIAADRSRNAGRKPEVGRQ